jgi:hypothetical protein
LGNARLSRVKGNSQHKASIRERIYAGTGDSPMAGILIYTAAADSDGTLGGLVDLGKPENLGRLIEQALNRSMVCSSDPLCSEHNPTEDRSLHAAACHACTFVAETSCERGNRYLDRALLVETFECKDAAFFRKVTKDYYCVAEEQAPYGSAEKW